MLPRFFWIYCAVCFLFKPKKLRLVIQNPGIWLNMFNLHNI
jgi:hypothetical protein